MKRQTIELFLNAMTVMFFIYLIVLSIEALVLHQLRIAVNFPGIQVSTYAQTAIIFAVLGLLLFKRFKYKLWPFVLAIAIFIEQTWGVAFSIHYGFFGLKTFSSLYSLSVYALVPVVLILWLKWYRTTFHIEVGTILFPLYFAYYYFIGMPIQVTDLQRAGIVHTTNPIPELVFVILAILFFEATFWIEPRTQ